MQNATVLDIFDLDAGIDPALDLDLFRAAVLVGYGAGHLLLRLDRVEAGDRDGFLAGEAKCLARVAPRELEGNDPHADEVRAVNALEVFGDHGLDAQQVGAFRGPVTAGAGAILLAPEDHERRALLLVGHGGVVDRALLAVRAESVAAFDIVEHLVADADIGEGAAHHDLVVAAARAVGVEFAHRNLPVDEILACRGRLLEGAGGRDVVGGDEIAQNGQNLGPFDIGDLAGASLHALEVGRVLDIGGLRRPVISLPFGDF